MILHPTAESVTEAGFISALPGTCLEVTSGLEQTKVKKLDTACTVPGLMEKTAEGDKK